MIAVGERTGQLEQMLERRRAYDLEVDMKIGASPRCSSR